MLSKTVIKAAFAASLLVILHATFADCESLLLNEVHRDWLASYKGVFWSTADYKTIHPTLGHKSHVAALVQQMQALAELSTKKELMANVPAEYIQEVRFWYNAPRNFHLTDCKSSNRFQKHYDNSLPNKDASRPSLLKYLNHVKSQLLTYCVKKGATTVAKQIKSVSSKYRDLVEVMVTDDDTLPGNLVAKRVAAYGAQFYDKTRAPLNSEQSVLNEVLRIYSDFDKACQKMSTLPETVSQTAHYLKEEGAIELVDPVLIEFIRIEQGCKELPDTLREVASLMPDAVRRYETYLQSHPKASKSSFFRSLFGRS